jgi:phytanoyl-CoA hydroxylase
LLRRIQKENTAMSTTLSAAQAEQFNHDGYLVLRGQASAAARETMLAVSEDHLRRAVPPIEYEAEVGYPGAPESRAAPGGATARRLRAAWQRHECFRQWAQDPHLASGLAQLFGEPVCVTLAHHNCVMTKHPDFGTATGWHRDIRYWRFSGPDLISAWLALGEENEANGALRVIPGSHRLAIGKEQMDDLDFLRPDAPGNRELFERGISLELQPGDVLLFHSQLFHSAGRNNSASVKYSVVFAYHGQSNQPVPGSRSAAAGSVLLGA